MYKAVEGEGEGEGAGAGTVVVVGVPLDIPSLLSLLSLLSSSSSSSPREEKIPESTRRAGFGYVSFVPPREV